MPISSCFLLYLLEPGLGLEEDTINTLNRIKTLGKENEEGRLLDQTLFMAVLLLYHSKKTQTFKHLKHFTHLKRLKYFPNFETLFQNFKISKYLSQPHSSEFGVRVINAMVWLVSTFNFN